MGICSYCEIYERESYWKSYCKNCADLRRLLIIHDSKTCISILKRVLLRNEIQIDHKVNMELKKKVVKEIESNDIKDYDKSPLTRSKSKVEK